MKRTGLVLIGALTFLAATPATFAQPKDPFRPPAGAGPEAPPAVGEVPVPGGQPPADPAPRGDGLARTGQDVGTSFALGTFLLAAGLALVLFERTLRGPRGAAVPRLSSAARTGIGSRSHTLEKHTFVI